MREILAKNSGYIFRNFVREVIVVRPANIRSHPKNCSMFKNLAPYQWAGAALAGVIVLLTIVSLRFPGVLPAFLNFGFIAGFSTVLYLACSLEIYLLGREFADGHLFPMRNLTFFAGLVTFVAFPFTALYAVIGGEYLVSAYTIILLPVFLYMCLRALFYVRLNAVQFAAKIGLRPTVHIARFDITEVREDERGLTVFGGEGQEVHLFPAFFFGRQWARLRAELLG